MTNAHPRARLRRGCALGGVLVLLLICAVASGLAGAVMDGLTQREVARSESADGLSVAFVETGSPTFFGPSEVRLVLREGRVERARVDLTLSNDGKHLTQENWHVLWQGDGVSVRLVAEEQGLVVCTLELDGEALCASQ